MGIIVCFLDEKMIFKFCTVNPIFVKKASFEHLSEKTYYSTKEF